MDAAAAAAGDLATAAVVVEPPLDEQASAAEAFASPVDTSAAAAELLDVEPDKTKATVTPKKDTSASSWKPVQVTPWKLSGPLSGRLKSHWMQDNSDMVETSSNEGSPTSFESDAMAPDLFAAIVDDMFFDVFSDYTSNGHQLMIGGETDESQPVDQPVNVNEFVDSHGKTLLHQACRYGRYHVVKCLLFHGANVWAQCKLGRTPFHDAVSSGKREGIVEVLGLLYKHDPSGITLVDRNGTHVLHLAAIHGRLDVLKWCSTLESGSPTDSATENTRTVIPMAITSFSGRNVLHYAAYNGRLPVIQWLLSDDNEKKDELSISSLDVNGYSILHYASMGGHLNICQWLVFHASSRNELNIKAKTSGGQTVADLAKLSEIKNFLSQIAQPPPAPCNLRCVGADDCSIGISWKIDPPLNPLLLEVLAPKWVELEYCKKPTGLARASGIFTMLMTMPSSTGAPSIFKWEQVGALIDPRATEYWICGLEKETEYLIRMRAMNRNGYGAYSLITMSGDFATTNGSSNTFEVSPGVDYHYLDAAFIGTLHFELLEARHLRVSPCKRTTSRKEAADQGRFYGVLSLQTPWISSPSNRRRNQNTGGAEESKCLYRIRSEFARVQEEMVRAGSLHAFRHPCFKLQTILRVPEASQSMLTVEIHHDTLREDSCIGVATVPLMEFVRGLPAKMRWLPLEYNTTNDEDGEEMLGEILIRTLFLADGISEIPHPTQLDVYCSTAEELLTDSDGSGSEESSPTNKGSPQSAFSSPPNSLPSVATTQFDRMGFRIYDPREKPRIGSSSPVSLLQSRRTFSYFRDHYECMAAQQDRNWLRFHRRWHSSDVDTSEPIGLFKTDLSEHLASNCMANCEQHTASCPYEQRGSNRLRRLAWYGIPPSSRPALYMRMSGALRKQYAHPNGYFQKTLKQAMALKEQNDMDNDAQTPPRSSNKFETARRQIQVDLQRTFAGNQCWINTIDGQLALERVLLTYAVHNESVGYCQSMTFIVGRLLCLFHFYQQDQMASEEQVFWLLATFCEEFFPSYYTHGMSGLQIDGQILEALMRRRLPKVFRHFELLQTPHIGLLLVTQWLLPICCAVFPSETSFRVLDAIIYEGPNVVFAIMIALLRISQTELLAETKDYMQLFRFLKERDMRLYDAALLMEIAFDEHVLLESTIDPLRSELTAQSDTKEATSKA